MAGSFVAMNDALVHHAIDDGSRVGESCFCFGVLTFLKSQSRFADGAAQLRSERVVTGSMHRRLPGSFFSRFRIRQSTDSLKSEPRSLPTGAALVNEGKATALGDVSTVRALKPKKPEYNHSLSPWN
jgi:hypothetical protein